MNADEGVTQITIVDTEPSTQTEVLSLMKARAHFMGAQPGFIRSIYTESGWTPRDQSRPMDR